MPREALLVRTMVELADNLVDDFDVIDLLSLLSARCVEALDVEAAGVMLAAPSGELQVVASSSETMRILELFELQSDEGPCVECYRSRAPIVNVKLTECTQQWPRFSSRALAAGFNSVHALPMRVRGRTIGALNLFQSAGVALDEADVHAGQALAHVATIAILQHQTSVEARVVNGQLTQALDSRVVIEQAKGRISQAAMVDMDQAFRRLRNHARNHNLRLADLSRSIAEGDFDPGHIDALPPNRRR